jgi:hypothetical protein
VNSPNLFVSPLISIAAYIKSGARSQ